MSILFADIFEAIRTLRVCKGTSQKEILNYVQERAGGSLSVNNVIKTMCTLNKLVEEGVLVKKGRRYSLPKPPPKQDDDDMDQEEDKDDECDEDEDDGMKDSCDDIGDDEEDCPEGGDDEDDDDDNDDDDDGEDDDDDDGDDDDDDDDNQCANKDDDDDDNCNDKVEENKKEEKKRNCPEGEGEDEVEKRANVNANGATNGNGPTAGKGEVGSSELICATSFHNNLAAQKLSRAKKSNRYSGMINKAENIAFCVRDFMDSHYQSYSEVPSKMEDVMEEDQKESKDVANIFQARRRGSRSRQSHLSNPNYRSRSPVKGAATDAIQHRLAMEASGEIGPLGNLKEAGDMELDVEPNRREDFELFNRPSPVDSDPLTTRRSLDRRESYESTQEKKKVKPESVTASMNQYGLRNQGDLVLGILKAKDGKIKKEANETKKEKHMREASHSKKIGDKKSVCLFCDKKKRKKKN